MKKTQRWLCLLLAVIMLVGMIPQAGAAAVVSKTADMVTLRGETYEMRITLEGFRYGFYRTDGTEIIGAHQTSGLCFGPSGGTSYPVTASTYQGLSGDVAAFEVTNSNGGKATVKVHLFDRYVQFEIVPVSAGDGDLDSNLPAQTPVSGENSALLLPGSKQPQAATVRYLNSSKIPADGNYAVEAKVKIPKNGTRSAGIFAHYQAANAFHLFFIKPGAVAFKRLNEDGTSVDTMTVTKKVSVKTDTWYTLRLECEGKHFKGYVDGELVLDVQDSNASAAQLKGAPGLRTDKMDAYFDDLKVTSLDGTTVYYENDFEYASDASVKNDLTYAMGTQELTVTAPKTKTWLAMTGSPEAIAVTGGSDWSNYTVTAKTQLASGDELTNHGLLFGYQDQQNYYSFRFDAGETVKLVKCVNGAETVLGSAPFSYAFDKAYTLKAEMKSGTLTCFVDGEQKIVQQDSTFTSGKAGLRTNDTSSKTESFTVAGDGIALEETFKNEVLNGWSIVTGKVKVTDGSDETPQPAQTNYYVIDARLAGGIEYMYGLGDYGALGNTGGSVRETSNVVGVNRTARGSFTNWNSVARFISNFSIAPQLGFAQVLFETDDKRVAITDEQTLLGAYKTKKVDGLYYFFGTMEQIYADYKAVRNAAGYVDTKPHYEMFGLGWEAFGSLGWNAYQTSVISTLTDYLNSGYHLTWGVIGSGFWTGDRKALEGTTTSFGMWDDTAATEGRKDGLPNPRFPDPEALKQFFKDNNMKLLLGLRNHFKLPVEYGGKWDASVDGNFVTEALQQGYLLKNDDGSLYTVDAKYPTGGIERGKAGVLDAENPDAVKWFANLADLWGADGFKEDCMMLQTTHHDDNWNKLLQYMSEQKDDYMIVRNASYCLPGDVLRINDANYGTSNSSFNNSPDRMVINALAYAASGQSNVYPDIIGGTGANVNDPAQQNYIVRNAYMAALCPSQSVGVNVLKMNNQSMKDAAFRAINWHSTYTPYIYDAALKSYETGYPLSMTPLYIAYPDDTNTYDMINSQKRMFQWMLGESVLAAPLFGTDHQTATSRDVYLPEGKWIQYDTGEVFYGPQTLKDWESPIDQMPAFIGGKGVLIGEDFENNSYFAEVFPVAEKGSVYTYTFVDGTTKSTVANANDGWSASTLEIWDVTTNQKVTFEQNAVNGSFKFRFEAGHSYELRGGKGNGTLQQVRLSAEADRLEPGRTLQTVLSAKLDDGTAADLTDAGVRYVSSDETVATVDAQGVITAHKAGTAEIFAEVTLKDNSGDLVVVQSNRITVTVPDSSITITSGVAITDDFSDGSLDGWVAHQGGYTVQDGALRYGGAAGRGTIVTTAETGSDYTIEADVTVRDTTEKATFGMVFRYNNADSNYLFVYTWGTGIRFLKRYTGGLAQNITDAALQLEPNVTYHFKAVVEGEHFVLYIDDNKVLDVTDDHVKADPIASGSCGLYASNQTATFDNVKIVPRAALPLTIAGTSEQGAGVQVEILGKQFPAVLNLDGTWTCSIDYLPAGSHTVTAKLFDAAGTLLTETSGLVTIAAETGADKQALLAAVEAARAYTPEGYTADSWQTLQNALAAARLILTQQDAAQADVDGALAALNDAIAGLTLTPVTPVTPVIPVTPSKPAKNPFNPNAGSNVSKFPFTDVPSNSWYYSSVKAAWENDLIDGVTANEFKPNATLTVAQAIKLAAALHQLDRIGEVSLKNGGANWYDSYVNYAVVNGIIEKDYANYTKAQMNAPVTRGEFVHIFHGAEEAYKAINTVADGAIPDVKTTDKFAAEIYEFYRAGILTGSDVKGTFHADSTIKRSEAAAILLRMFESAERKSITLK